MKFGTTKGHVGRLGHTKFHANRFTGVGTRAPKWQKFPLFDKESPPQGRTLWPISTVVRGFYTANYPPLRFLHLRWFASQVTELLLRNRASVIYPEFFRAPWRKNYALDRKMNDTFLMDSTSSITVQSLGKIVLRAPAVGAKMWSFSVTRRRRRAVRSRGA